ncbi:MAG: hypothetical protein LBB46_00380 [Coriobacteriaceae bacterium]|nr:hypothetical protein [Coriobacteriaceae bacterium]
MGQPVGQPQFVAGNPNFGAPSNAPMAGGPNTASPQPPSANSGCSMRTMLIALAVFFGLMLIFALFASMGDAGGMTRSTIERVALPASATNQTEYFTDADGGWIHSPNTLISGMRSFFQETGVAPYLYIMPNGTSTSSQELTRYAEQLYPQLFTDEGHFLLVFCDDGRGSYACGYVVGAQAKTVMDSEATSILNDYLDRHYYNNSLSEEEVFSRTFADTGQRIMAVEQSPLVPIIICLTLVAIAAAAYFILKNRREQRARDQKHIEEVLSMPIESFGDQEAKDLADKYKVGTQDPQDTQGGTQAAEPAQDAQTTQAAKATQNNTHDDTQTGKSTSDQESREEVSRVPADKAFDEQYVESLVKKYEDDISTKG